MKFRSELCFLFFKNLLKRKQNGVLQGQIGPKTSPYGAAFDTCLACVIRMVRLFKPHFGLNKYADKGTILLRSCPDLLLTPLIKKQTKENIWNIIRKHIWIFLIYSLYIPYIFPSYVLYIFPCVFLNLWRQQKTSPYRKPDLNRTF